MIAQRGSRENAKGRQDAITMIPSEKPKKILTENVITCIEEYLGKTLMSLCCKVISSLTFNLHLFFVERVS